MQQNVLYAKEIFVQLIFTTFPRNLYMVDNHDVKKKNIFGDQTEMLWPSMIAFI